MFESYKTLPTVIEGTTGHSTKYATQMLTNPNNLTSTDINLAYWGVKRPKYMGNYLRDWPDAVSSRNGSFFTPEKIIAKGFNKPSNVNDDGIIKSIKVIYKIGKISYSSKTAHGTFKAPTIELKNGNTSLSSIKGHAPPEDGIQNNSGENVNAKELKNTYTEPFDITNKILHIKDIPNLTVSFANTNNTSTNHCRVVMQYLQLEIEYEDTPCFRTSIAYSGDREKQLDSEFNVWVQVEGQNSISKNTHCEIKLPTGLEFDRNNIKTQYGDANNDVYRIMEKDGYNVIDWEVNQLNDTTVGTDIVGNINKIATAKIFIPVKATKTGEYTISSEVMEFADANYKGKDSRNFLVYKTTRTENLSLKLSQHLVNIGENVELDVFYTTNKGINGTVGIRSDTFNVKWYTYINGIETPIELPYTNNTYYFEVKTEEATTYVYKGIVDTSHSANGSFSAFKNDNTGATNTNAPSVSLTVQAPLFDRENLSLTVEDGTSVEYNHIIFTKGDDLEKPLIYKEYELDNSPVNKIRIEGHNKHIPLNQVQYVTFDVSLPKVDNIQDVISYKNLLFEPEIINQTDGTVDNIIVGCNSDISLLDSKYIVLNSISSGETKEIKLAVHSDVIKTDNITLLLYGKRTRIVKVTNTQKVTDDTANNIEKTTYTEYEETFSTPAKVLFEDLASLKLNIYNEQNIYDFTYNIDKYGDLFYTPFDLIYTVQNVSNIEAKNVKIKINEPQFFKIDNDKSSSNYNHETNIWNIGNLSVNEIKQLVITYTPTRKGIYQFSSQTIDSDKTFDDDIYQNEYRCNVMVDYVAKTNIVQNISNTQPNVNELLDYTIEVTNNTKTRNILTINIDDIGNFNDNHLGNHYQIESIDCEYGKFTKGTNKLIGTWVLENLGINKTYYLNLTLRPISTGSHDIRITSSEIDYSNTLIINILKNKAKVNMNAYQGIDLRTNKNTPALCTDYTQFCDDDFLSLGDEFGYVINVTNNSKNDNDEFGDLYLDIILPKELSDCVIDDKYFNYRDTTYHNIITLKIPILDKCKTNTVCLGIKPKTKGSFSTLIVLYGDNIDVQTKRLTINVDDVFPEYQLEHYLSIYNFERSNKYYTYQSIYGATDLQKLFHKGDRSLRMIERNPYSVKTSETYTGFNLKDLCSDIENSRYIKPVFLREGTNQLKNDLYQIYPDGFIRRFGLLQSEIYHNTGVLPKTVDMIDSVMKWDVDNWDSKLWGGDIWDSGVFKISIDYSKIPSNFNRIKMPQLQNIVNETKPYGLKGIAYYSDTEEFRLKIKMKDIATTLINSCKFLLSNIDMGILSKYIYSDGRLIMNDNSVTFDMNKINLIFNDIKYKTYSQTSSKNNRNAFGLLPKMDVSAYYFQTKYYQNKISEYNDIFNFNNLSKFTLTKIVNNKKDSKYHYSIDKKSYNINNASNDIHSTVKSELIKDPLLSNEYQLLYAFNEDIVNNTEFGVYLEDDSGKNILRACRFRDLVSGQDGFRLMLNDDVLNLVNINNKVYSFQILVQRSQDDYLHFFYIINNENIAYHFGFYKDYNRMNNQGVYTLKTRNIPSTNNYNFDNIYVIYDDSDVTVSLSNNYKTITKSNDNCIQIKDDIIWDNFNNLYNSGEYISCKYSNDKDKECILGNSKKYTSPIVACFDNIDIDDSVQIKDIGIKLKAESNKSNFMNDIDASIILDGNSYIPKDVGNKIIYPNNVANIGKEYYPSIDIEEDNVTYCNNCGSKSNGIHSYCPVCESTDVKLLISTYTTCHHCGLSSKGYYTLCPNCKSSDVTYNNINKTSTYCNNCKDLIDGYYDICPHCKSSDTEIIGVTSNITQCDNCGRLSGGFYSLCPFCFSPNVEYKNRLSQQEYNYKLYSNDVKYPFNTIHFDTDINKVQVCDLKINMNKDSLNLDKLSSMILHIKGKNNLDYQFHVCGDCNNIGDGKQDYCSYCNSDNVQNYGTDFIKLIGYAVFDGVISNLNIDSPIINYGDFDISIDILNLIKKNKKESFTLRFFIQNNYEKSLLPIINGLNIIQEDKDLLKAIIQNINIDITDIGTKSEYIESTSWSNTAGLLDKTKPPLTFITSYNKNQTDIIKLNNFNFNNISSIETSTLKIHGINYSEHNISLYLKTNLNNEYELLTTEIENGIFNYEYNLLNLLSEKEINNNLEISLYFDNIDVDTKLEILDIYIDTDYQKNILSLPVITNNVYNKVNYDNYYLLTSNNVWGLLDNVPKQIDGYNINNRILGVIDFNKLDYNEYIKLYNISLVIKYIDKKGTFVTKYIENQDNDSTKIQVQGNIINNNGEYFGNLTQDYQMITNDESINEDVNGEYLNYIELHKGLYQSFIPSYNEINSIEINTLGRIGYPDDKIKISIYSDNNNKPDKILTSTYIDGWGSQSNCLIRYDLLATELDIDKQYWIALELDNYDKYNYYTLKFNKNKIGSLLESNDGTSYKNISNISLSFNLYQPIYRYSFNNLPTTVDGDYSFRIKNTIFRHNINDNIYLSNIKALLGKDYTKDYQTSVTLQPQYEARAGTHFVLSANVINNDNTGYVEFFVKDISIGKVRYDPEENAYVCICPTNSSELGLKISSTYDYEVKAVFIPDNETPYKSSSATSVLKIIPFEKPKITTLFNDNVLYNDDLNIRVLLENLNGDSVSDGQVNIKILDTYDKYNTKYQINENIIVKNGVAELTVNTKNIDLVPYNSITNQNNNRYKLITYYKPNEYSIYSESDVQSQYINIKQRETELSTNADSSFVGYSGQHLTITLSEKDTHKKITGQVISINYHEEGNTAMNYDMLIKDGSSSTLTNLTKDIDNQLNGLYVISLSLAPKNWIFTIEYPGNEYYTGSKLIVPINVSKILAQINREENSMKIELTTLVSDKSLLKNQTVIMYEVDNDYVVASIPTTLYGSIGIADFSAYKLDGNTHVKYKLADDSIFYTENELDGYR